MTIFSVALNKLTLSGLNVRKAAGDITSLKASIAAHGLLQNLQVLPVNKKKGIYEVVAGGRRLAALNELAADGKIPADFAVPCQKMDKQEAVAVSLAENTIRQDMTAAEQFRAFSALAASGKSNGEIAVTFGVSEAHVQRMLRLANVAEALFHLFEQGQLSLEQMKAYAVSDNHKKQLEIYSQVGMNASHYVIRRAMTEEHVSANDKRAKFVTLEAYQAEGGAVETDLFSDDVFLLDVALLERLVEEKTERAITELESEGWSFVELSEAARWEIRQQYGTIRSREREMTEAEQEQLAALEQAHIEAEEAWHDGSDDEAYTVYEQTGEALAAFQNGSLYYADADKARGGVVLLLDDDGELEIFRGMVSPEVARKEAREQRIASGEVKKSRISAKLSQDLSVHKTAAVRYEVMNSPALAYDAMLVSMVIKTFYHVGKSPLTVTFSPVSLTSYSKTVAEASEAYQALEMVREEWESRLPESPNDVWAFIRGMEQDEKALLFAVCAAGLVNCIDYERGGNGYGLATAELEAFANVDMVNWWRPTKTTYLAHVKKAQVIEAVEDAHGKRYSKNLSTMKKDALHEQAEKLLDGQGWLPPELRKPESVDTPEEQQMAA